ncbi:DUF1328 domain-containing protein [Terricaulis sp.]|uniref:DUF1328 domain-containing protein n=1 Tax=Terricaulis sp. TaxID=2768686 RepID=UPI003784A1A3
MLGWAIGFFVAALVAAVFGFGGLAATFSGIAVILFWVFLALFVLSLLFGAFRGAGHGAVGGGGTAATVAIIAGVAILTYAWVKNDWSAEKMGASIDHNVSQLAENTGDALETAGDRAQDVAQQTSEEVRNDASEGLDEAGDRVDPDNTTSDDNN